MSNLVKDRKRKYLYDLKFRCSNRYKQSVNKAFILVHRMGLQAREAIAIWKKNAQAKTLQMEAYEEGPVREEYLDERQKLINL